MTSILALEFFSGIGGLHCALNEAAQTLNIAAKVVASFDVNPNANAIYAANFPDVQLLNKDLKGITAKWLTKKFPRVNLWLLSPPCQPYSRNGKQRDVSDPRAMGLLQLLQILKELSNPPTYILIENVEGFEESASHARLLEAARQRGYQFQEFVLSPNTLGVPNLRDRYFFLATRRAKGESGHPEGAKSAPVLRSIPDCPRCREVVYKQGSCAMGTLASQKLWESLNAHCARLCDGFLVPGADEDESLLVPDKTLRQCGGALDVVAPASRRTCCFTKAYTRYGVGTGSVLVTRAPASTATTTTDTNPTTTSITAITSTTTTTPVVAEAATSCTSEGPAAHATTTNTTTTTITTNNTTTTITTNNTTTITTNNNTTTITTAPTSTLATTSSPSTTTTIPSSPTPPPSVPRAPSFSIQHPVPRNIAHLKSLRLRYFAPREIARLHGFPESFKLETRGSSVTTPGVKSKPSPQITRKQMYGLLGNSLSVTVVAALLVHLFKAHGEGVGAHRRDAAAAALSGPAKRPRKEDAHATSKR